jgi:hypothetical protein
MKESKIQKQVIDYLTLNGWYVWKNKNTNRGTGIYLPTHQRGVADLTAISNIGVVVFIEIKTSNGKLSKEQEEFKSKIRDHCGLYCVIKSIEDLENLKYFMQKK